MNMKDTVSCNDDEMSQDECMMETNCMDDVWHLSDQISMRSSLSSICLTIIFKSYLKDKESEQSSLPMKP
jgi:hypothetical protein